MNIKKNLLFLLSLFMIFLLPNYAVAALNGTTLPKIGKVLICHYPPGNIANVQNITISIQAINAHFWDGVAGDAHQFDELEVNGVCPYAESQKTAATAAITTATAVVTTAKSALTVATTAVTIATTDLVNIGTVVKSDPNSQIYKIAVATAQTTLTQAVAVQTTAKTAVTAAETNLTTVKATADAVIAAVTAVTAAVAKEKADPTPSTITICHVNNSGNGRVETFTVSTNAWTDNATGQVHSGHAYDYPADVNNLCTSTTSLCCVSGVTTQCPTTITVPNYTGECNVPVCPATNSAGKCTSAFPDTTKEETLPSRPTSKVEEAIKPPADLGYCDDGGKRSYGETMSGITIKRARIANAETVGGTFESNALVGMQAMYGTLTAGSYDDNDHTCQQGYCVGKTITGATLTGAIIDIATDYVDAAGNVIDNSHRGISLTGGVTNPTSFKKDGVTPINATITNGMITAGTDSAGNPVRGSITTGQFANALTHGHKYLHKCSKK